MEAYHEGNACFIDDQLEDAIKVSCKEGEELEVGVVAAVDKVSRKAATAPHTFPVVCAVGWGIIVR